MVDSEKEIGRLSTLSAHKRIDVYTASERNTVGEAAAAAGVVVANNIYYISV